MIYLIFNEGYAASAGPELTRTDLCDEAIRLARVLVTLTGDEPEAIGLLALQLLHHSRRPARMMQTVILSRLKTRIVPAGTATSLKKVALAAYQRALALSENEPERRFFRKRLPARLVLAKAIGFG